VKKRAPRIWAFGLRAMLGLAARVALARGSGGGIELEDYSSIAREISRGEGFYGTGLGA
jgi:hypothetical protein